MYDEKLCFSQLLSPDDFQDLAVQVLQNLDEFLFFSSNLNIGTIVTMPYAMEGSVEEGYTGIENEKEKNKH